MDLDILIALQGLREGSWQFLREFAMKMTFLTDKETSIVIVAIIYWCVSKEYGNWLWLGWSINRLINGFLKVTACVYRPWIREPQIVPDAEAKVGATGYSFPSGHSTNAASIFGSGIFYKKFRPALRFLFGVMLILVAFSRTFLSVHTPQDVAVGLIVGLIVMYLTMRLISYLNEHPRAELSVAAAGIILSLAVAFYAGLKSYPVDYDADGNILVEGAKMARDTYKAAGWCFAVFASRTLEARFVRFSTDVPLTDRIFRLVAGLIGLYVVDLIICPFVKDALGNTVGIVCSSFLLIIYIMFLFPLIFVKLEKSRGQTLNKI